MAQNKSETKSQVENKKAINPTLQQHLGMLQMRINNFNSIRENTLEVAIKDLYAQFNNALNWLIAENNRLTEENNALKEQAKSKAKQE